jgi:shikimate kinase
VLLVGLMGSGKTTIGRALAELTGWPHVDNDELLRAAAGMSAREVLARGGEAALRLAEADALDAALATPPPCVCGVAAGTITSAAARARLAGGGIVVWLTADPQVLAQRAVGAAHRPWLEKDAEGWLRAVAVERDPLYREIADVTIDTSERSPDEIADDLADQLAQRAACRPWLAEHLD